MVQNTYASCGTNGTNASYAARRQWDKTLLQVCNNSALSMPKQSAYLEFLEQLGYEPRRTAFAANEGGIARRQNKSVVAPVVVGHEVP
jgi:hypothetical protein